jgi:hypothetical protein
MVVMKTGVQNSGELGTGIHADQLNNNNNALSYVLHIDSPNATVNGIESQGGNAGLFVGDPSGIPKNGGVGVWGKGGDAGSDPRIDQPPQLTIPPGAGVRGEAGKPGLTDGAHGVEGYGSGNFSGVAGFGGAAGGAGVYGLGGPLNTGVVGQGGTAPADGVRGYGTGSFSGVAGFGDPASNGTGVFGKGQGSGAPGVRGIGSGVPTTDPGGAVGVYGQGGSRRSALGPLEGGYPGVVGQAGPALPAGGTNGVEGYGAGSSAAGVAGFGDLNGSGMGVYGYGHLGVVAAADGLPGAIGLLVSGEAHVNGNLLVLGSKSAAVPFADGSHRRLYCMESPECWFEDFGEANLVKGKAQIKLPRDFAAVIQPDSYHVFLTPYGRSNGLCVSKRTRQGFVVEEQGGGKSSLSFAFRIVGKRKGLKAERFAKIAMPKVPKPPKLPARVKVKAKVPIKPSIGQPPPGALSAG